jgi:hypothetical protein
MSGKDGFDRQRPISFGEKRSIGLLFPRTHRQLQEVGSRGCNRSDPDLGLGGEHVALGIWCSRAAGVCSITSKAR